GLLHAVFGTEPDFLAVDLEAAVNLKAEATPVFRDALLIALNLEHERVAGLVDDPAPHMSLARIRRVQDLDLEADELVFPQVHSGLLRRGLGRRSRGARAPLLLGHDRQDARDVFPEGSDLSGIRRGAAHRGDAAFVHELVTELRQLLLDPLRVHGPDLLRAKQGHYAPSPPSASTSTSTPSCFTSLATFFNRFVATLLFFTLAVFASASSASIV